MANIEEKDIGQFTFEYMSEYQRETVLERALPSVIDGLIPVQRMTIWGMYTLGIFHNKPSVKTLRVGGDVMGKLWPHGADGVYGSLQMMCQSWIKNPIVNGIGNWGDYCSPRGGQSYTECKLTEFGEKLFLDPKYLEVIPYTLNYTGEFNVPIYLPAKLPAQYLIGNFGIAVGTSNNTPIFTLESLKKACITVLKNGNLAEAPLKPGYLYRNEDFDNTTYINDKNSFYHTLIPTIEVIDDKHFKLSSWFDARQLTTLNKLEKVLDYTIESIDDNGSAKVGPQFIITTKYKVAPVKQRLFIEELQKKLTMYATYRLNFVDNSTIIDTELCKVAKTKFIQSSLLDSIQRWANWRVDLEIKYLNNVLHKLHTKLSRYLLDKLLCEHKEEILKNIAILDDNGIKNLLKERIPDSEDIDELFNILHQMTIGNIRKLDLNTIDNNINKTKTEITNMELNLKDPISSVIKTIEEL